MGTGLVAGFGVMAGFGLRPSFKRSSTALGALSFALSLVGAMAVSSSASAQLTNGRIRPRPQAATGFTACLAMEGSECRLIAPAVAIAIGVENGDAVISYLDPLQAGYVVQRKESVALDLEQAMVNGVYGDPQAALIFAELLSMHELMYRLPADQIELKRAMGFPPQVQLSPEDQVGVLTSHLQLTLGVSAITADYLITKLGVRVLPKETPAAPVTPVPPANPVPSAVPVVPEAPATPEPVGDPNLAPVVPAEMSGFLPAGFKPELTPEMEL